MLKVTLFIAIFFAALYFGSGGFITLKNDQLREEGRNTEKRQVIYKNIKFENEKSMISAVEQDMIKKVYPYLMEIPSVLSFLITAISFGIIGSFGKVINDTIKLNNKLKDTPNLLLIPLQGAMIGIIILGIAYTIPMVLTNENISLKPISIVFLSLFGGVSYLNFFNWFSFVLNKVLFSKKEQ